MEGTDAGIGYEAIDASELGERCANDLRYKISAANSATPYQNTHVLGCIFLGYVSRHKQAATIRCVNSSLYLFRTALSRLAEMMNDDMRSVASRS